MKAVKCKICGGPPIAIDVPTLNGVQMGITKASNKHWVINLIFTSEDCDPITLNSSPVGRAADAYGFVFAFYKLLTGKDPIVNNAKDN